LKLKSDRERDIRRDFTTIAAARREKPLTDPAAVRLGPSDPRLVTGIALRDADGEPLVGVRTKRVVTELVRHHAAQLLFPDTLALLVCLVFQSHDRVGGSVRPAG
jgi:hypothetical protein